MKRINFIIFLSVMAIMAFQESIAQDIHYSQSFNTPLNLNPALTGKVDGTFRAGINYRNQWFGLVSGRSTYSTATFFGDMPFRFKSKNIIGVGLSIVSDKSSGGNLSQFSGMLSLAYHQALGKKKKHFFSFGLQGGLLQRKLDLANIKLADQIILQEENVFNGSRDNISGSASAFDLQAGFDWSSQFGENVHINAGYGAFHLFQPELSFSDNGEKMPMRHTAHAGANFSLGEHFAILPHFVYMTQMNAEEMLAGLSAEINFNKDVGLQLGGYYRFQDAAIPYVGIEIKGFKMGMSYDFTTSSLKNTSGGIEISLLYIGGYIAVPDVVPSLYCPRF